MTVVQYCKVKEDNLIKSSRCYEIIAICDIYFETGLCDNHDLHMM